MSSLDTEISFLDAQDECVIDPSTLQMARNAIVKLREERDQARKLLMLAVQASGGIISIPYDIVCDPSERETSMHRNDRDASIVLTVNHKKS